MTFAESIPVEQLIHDAAAKLGGEQASVRRGNTRLGELAL
jgi:hypothetical protein